MSSSDRKRLAIVSSYNENCGNASYTEALRKEFQKWCDVDIIPLELDILSSNRSNIVKMADKHIDDIANRLKTYDYVNIQFEAGLYGSSRAHIYQRVKKLIKASNNVIVTMHRVDLPNSFRDVRVLKQAFSSKNIFRNINNLRRTMYFENIYKLIVDVVKEHSQKYNANIIVHTKRDKKNIERIFGFDQVYDFPLCFLDEKDRKRKREEEERKSFLEKYSLDCNDVVIGLFGFVNEYKGHETAIKALKFLPDNYKILIFGSQHPMTIQPYSPVDPYIKKLVNLIEEDSTHLAKTEKSYSLDKRVFFVGNLDDDDFIDALYCCDFAVLPYMEVNQSGSGIASLVLETKIKSIFSNSKAFAELNKYFPNTFEKFDIGNYSELAYKIKNYKSNYENRINECMSKYNIENSIRLHLDIFEGKIQK